VHPRSYETADFI